jgi:uncharacterized membrane protein YfcA
MLAWSFIPPEVSNVALFLALGSVSAMLFSMAKSGFGGSVGMLGVPIMIFACGGKTSLAMGILLPILIAADYVAVASWLGKWSWRPVLLLLPGMVAGVGAGWALLHILAGLEAATGRNPLGGPKGLTDQWLKLGVGVVALVFVALQAIRSLRGRPLAFRPVFWQASAAGVAAGFTSTISHAAGPIVAMYMLPQQMPKGRYVATTALCYWIGNQIKLVPYFAEGMINTNTLLAGVALVPGVVVGAVLGIVLHKRVDARQFTGIVYVLLALAGAELCYKGLTALLR